MKNKFQSNDVGMKLGGCRQNIQRTSNLSPTNHQRLTGSWKYFLTFLLVLAMSIGNVWGDINFKVTSTVSIDNKKVKVIDGAYVTRNGSNTSVTSSGWATGGGDCFAVFDVAGASTIKAYLCNTSTSAVSGKTISCGAVSSTVWTALGTAATNGTQYQMTTGNVSSSSDKSVSFDKNAANTETAYEFTASSAGKYAVYWASSIGSNVYLTKIEIVASSGSCSAPTSPSVTASPSASYTEGDNISLSASATGTTSGTTTYTWYKGAVGDNWATVSATTPIQAASTTGSSFTIENCETSDEGVYWCNISNGDNCNAQASLQVSVTASSGGGENPEPPAVVCPESGVVFSADAKTTSDKKFSAGTTEITSSDADITGGAVYAISGQSDQKVLLTKNGQFSMTNNNTIFKFELDCALAAGDRITIDGQGGTKTSNNVTTNKGLWVTSTEDRPSSAPACSGDNGTDGWYEPILSYVVTSTDEYVGKSTLFIHRQAGATQNFDNVVITRPYNISYESAKGTAQTTPTKGFEVALTQITGVDGWSHTGWTANKAVKVGTTDYAVGDEIPVSATAKLSDDTQFTAVWEANVTKHTVTYYDGTTELGTELVVENSNPTASEIVVPRKLGYTFGGWSTTEDGAAVALNTISVTADMPLYAVWNAVNCATKSGTIYTMSIAVAPFANCTITSTTGTHDLYQYEGVSGGEALLGNKGTSNNCILQTNKKILLKDDNSYIKLDFDCPLKEGDKIVYSVESNNPVVSTGNSKPSTPLATLDRSKTEFVIPAESGLIDAQTIYIWRGGGNTTVTYINIVRPAKFEVTFNMHGHGTQVEPQNILEGGKVTEPATTDITGWDFGGWYATYVAEPESYSDAWDFANDVVSDATELHAKWTEHVASNDVALGTLSVNGEAITIVPSQTVYAVELPFGTTAVPAVTATANDENVKAFTITQALAVDGSATIYVKAEDNTTEATYTINFTVADSKDLLLVFRTGTTACSEVSTASAMLSDNAAVSSYINKITFNNVEGTGDNGKETGGGSGSLDVGKKAGNMLTLSAKPGYALQAMSFYGKIQDETCEYSLDGGDWTTLSSTNTGGDACYTVFSDEEVHEFRLRSTGTSGVWIRNMELTMIQACTPKTIAWTAAPASEYEVGATVDPIAASANYGNVTYAASNAAITVADNGALTINSLTNDVDITASVAGGDGTTYCAAGASVAKEDIKTYYLVKFNAQNETDATEVKYYSGDAAIALPATPSYPGYVFQGWFDAAEGGNAVTGAITPEASRTVYAQWEAQCVGPTITTQPASTNYFTGRTSVALTGAATAGNGGALTYTWYSCDDAERNNPVALSGAPTPSTAVVGTQYYYFTVTEAGCDVVKTSNVAVITVADKDMLCLVKANVGDKTLTYDNTSFYAENKVTLAENDQIRGKDESYYEGYKFQSGAILQVGLKEASFEENDIIEVYVGAVANNGGYQKMRAFNADEAVLANIVAESAENMVEGVNRIVLTEDAADLYFMRKDDYSKWNPHVAYVAVYRAYPVPVLTAMTVNGSAATIAGTNVAATIASNAELASLTLVPTFMSNDPENTNGALGGPWVENENVYTNSYVVTDKDGDTKTYTITLTRDVEIASVTISGETTVAEESQITLTATVLPNNVLNKEVTWSSSDETKAVVDANGVVTGKAAGAVTITATAVADNTKKGTYDITVTPFIGTKYAYWFTKTGDIPSDLANDDGTVFEDAPTDVSNLAASMTVEINGVDREFTVTRRSGDVAFGTFHVPAGFTADLYMLAVGSGDGRSIQLKETTTEATYKSDPESFGGSAVKLVFSAIPAGNYSYDKIGGNSRVAMMVAALNSYPLSSITLSDMTMRIGNTGKPAMTLDHAKAAITSQTWSIVENNAAGTTIDASTGVITAGTTPGTVTVKVVAVDAMSNEVTSNTCTVTIVDIYERVDVTGDITWNWNEAANTSNVAVATANGLALANYINGEKWQKISGTHGDYAYNTNASGSYQGKGKLAFHTTVPGIVKVTARRISNNADIMLGDRLIGELTSTVKVYPAMYVPAGEVEIIADATEGMRVTKIEFKATAEYTRPVNPAYLGTLCWKNNAILGGATLFEFAGKNENNYLVFDEVEENRIEAGKPYIFMPENGITEIKVYNIDDAAALTEDQAPVNNMYGTIEGRTLVSGVDDNMYYFSSNHIWRVGDFSVDINVPAYYCYIDYPAVLAAEPAPSTPAPGRRRVTMGVQGEQVVTGMGEIEASETPMKVMIDGQLFIIRGEKMFDATGRLVK